MADPSRATIQAEWGAAIKVLNQIRLFGNVNATNFLALINSLETIYAGDYISDASSTIQAIRSSLAGTVSQGAALTLFRPFLRTYCKSVIGRTDLSDDQSMWTELYRYFVDNNLRVDSRRLTFGSPALSIGSGSVQILRLTVDKFNFLLEGGYADSKRATCVIDQNTGSAQGNESWLLVGQDRAKDELQRSGSGLQAVLAGQTLDDSLLTNPGFRAFGGTAASPTSLTGWTSSAGDSSSIYTLDATNYYRVAPSDGSTSYALNLVSSDLLTQKLTVRGTELSDDVPYTLAVVWNRAVNSATGTLVLRMGGMQTTVAVSAQTGWNVTTVPSPIGQGSWYRQFYQNDLQIQIDWTKTGGTGLLIGEVLLVPASLFDGSYYWVLPTSAASWSAPKVRDEFTWMDGEPSSGGVNQRWIARASFGAPPRAGYGYLPASNGSSITWADS